MATLYSKIEEAKQKRFTGRRKERSLLKLLIITDKLEKNIVAITGVGGIGKSTLISIFRKDCELSKIPIGIVSGQEHGSPIAIMVALGTQIRSPGNNKYFREFDQVYNKITQIQRKLAIRVSQIPKNVSDVAIAASSEGVGAVIGGILGSFIGPIGTVIGAAGGAVISEVGKQSLNKLLQEELAPGELDYLAKSVKRITECFTQAINNVSIHCRLVIVIDTYEAVIAFVDEWVRLEFLPKLDNNILVIIAGRDALVTSKWQSFWPHMIHIELEPFDQTETSLYLTKVGIRSKTEQETIFEATKGLPLGVALLGDIKDMSALSIANEQFFSQQGMFSIVVREVVDRLFRQIPDDHTKKSIRLCAIPRLINEDILQVLIPDQDPTKTLNELQRYGSLIHVHGKGISLHDEVRVYLLEDLTRMAPNQLKQTHSQLADYYKRLMEDIEKHGGAFSSEWEDALIERIYHTLSENEVEGVRLFETVYQIDGVGDKVSPLFPTVQRACEELLDFPMRLDSSKITTLFFSSWLAHSKNNWSLAEAGFRNLLNMQNLNEDRRQLVNVYMGKALHYRGKLLESCKLHEKALEYYSSKEHYDQRIIVDIFWHLSRSYLRLGRIQDAFSICTREMELENTGYDVQKYWNLYQLGQIYLTIGDYEKARACFLESKNGHDQKKVLMGVHYSTLGLGEVAWRLGEVHQAYVLAEEALKEFQILGESYGDARTKGVLASFDLATQKYSEAEKRLQECKNTYIKEGNIFQETTTCLSLVELYTKLGNRDLAEYHGSRVRVLSIENKYWEFLARISAMDAISTAYSIDKTTIQEEVIKISASESVTALSYALRHNAYLLYELMEKILISYSELQIGRIIITRIKELWDNGVLENEKYEESEFKLRDRDKVDVHLLVKDLLANALGV